MNNDLMQMLKVSEGRHLTEIEESLFQDYYQHLPARLQAMQALEKHEAVILSQSSKLFFERFANLAELPDADSKMQRDMDFLYKAAALAMVQQDISQLAEKAYFVFSIFVTLGFPGPAMDTAYAILAEETQKHLDAESWNLIRPYLNVLSNQRLQHWAEFKARQHALIQAGIAYVLQTWPSVGQLNAPEDNLRKDMLSLFQVVGEGLLSQSLEPIVKRKKWLYAYFSTLRFDMEMVYQTYAHLPQLATEHLSAETCAALAPYFAELSKK